MSAAARREATPAEHADRAQHDRHVIEIKQRMASKEAAEIVELPNPLSSQRNKYRVVR
jgi:hypothetical protein